MGKAEKQLTVTLDLGRELIRAGVEVWTVEDIIEKILRSYTESIRQSL